MKKEERKDGEDKVETVMRKMRRENGEDKKEDKRIRKRGLEG
jgi:hypothetical protein